MNPRVESDRRAAVVRRLLDHVAEPVAIVRNGEIDYANPALQRLVPGGERLELEISLCAGEGVCGCLVAAGGTRLDAVGCTDIGIDAHAIRAVVFEMPPAPPTRRRAELLQRAAAALRSAREVVDQATATRGERSATGPHPST